MDDQQETTRPDPRRDIEENVRRYHENEARAGGETAGRALPASLACVLANALGAEGLSPVTDIAERIALRIAQHVRAHGLPAELDGALNERREVVVGAIGWAREPNGRVVIDAKPTNGRRTNIMVIDPLGRDGLTTARVIRAQFMRGAFAEVADGCGVDAARYLRPDPSDLGQGLGGEDPYFAPDDEGRHVAYAAASLDDELLPRGVRFSRELDPLSPASIRRDPLAALQRMAGVLREVRDETTTGGVYGQARRRRY